MNADVHLALIFSQLTINQHLYIITSFINFYNKVLNFYVPINLSSIRNIKWGFIIEKQNIFAGIWPTFRV
jgi:hypothetical protein